MAEIPSAVARFALAHQRLRPDDEARRRWLDRHARNPDPDEQTAPLPCAVCGLELTKRPGQKRNSALCATCNAAGFRVKPCKGCGGPTHRRDHHGRSARRLGFCETCRNQMNREEAL